MLDASSVSDTRRNGPKNVSNALYDVRGDRRWRDNESMDSQEAEVPDGHNNGAV